MANINAVRVKSETDGNAVRSRARFGLESGSVRSATESGSVRPNGLVVRVRPSERLRSPGLSVRSDLRVGPSGSVRGVRSAWAQSRSRPPGSAGPAICRAPPEAPMRLATGEPVPCAPQGIPKGPGVAHGRPGSGAKVVHPAAMHPQKKTRGHMLFIAC